jgi:hypothetical protein
MRLIIHLDPGDRKDDGLKVMQHTEETAPRALS